MKERGPQEKSQEAPGIKSRLSRQGWRGKLKIAAYCLLPAITLICVAEIVVRIGGFDRPLAGSIFFGNPGKEDPIHRSDADLFYSLKPNLRTTWQEAMVTTNGLGLRSSEIGEKEANEFRVLSLGESSTFGAKVEDEETYSAQLEGLLNRADPSRRYRVINAGVSGYTSFQSLKYLELRGLDLEPDLVLFYHEQNDLLKAEYTDKELYESQSHAWHRSLADHLAIYRLISNTLAKRKIRQNRGDELTGGGEALPREQGIEEIAERTRVSKRERRKNLDRLHAICQEKGIRLVVIHPAYAGSKPHECVLTGFCRESGVPLFEAHNVLHPAGRTPGELFADESHPNAEGHRALAEALFAFMQELGIIPEAADN